MLLCPIFSMFLIVVLVNCLTFWKWCATDYFLQPTNQSWLAGWPPTSLIVFCSNEVACIFPQPCFLGKQEKKYKTIGGLPWCVTKVGGVPIFFLTFEKIFAKKYQYNVQLTFKPPVTTYDPKYCHNYYFFYFPPSDFYPTKIFTKAQAQIFAIAFSTLYPLSNIRIITSRVYVELTLYQLLMLNPHFCRHYPLPHTNPSL